MARRRVGVGCAQWGIVIGFFLLFTGWSEHAWSWIAVTLIPMLAGVVLYVVLRNRIPSSASSEQHLNTDASNPLTVMSIVRHYAKRPSQAAFPLALICITVGMGVQLTNTGTELISLVIPVSAGILLGVLTHMVAGRLWQRPRRWIVPAAEVLGALAWIALGVQFGFGPFS